MNSQRLTKIEVCKRLGIKIRTFNSWVDAGCPVAGKRKTGGKGRPMSTYNLARIKKWVEKNGRKDREGEGLALRNPLPKTKQQPAEQKKPAENAINELGMLGYVTRLRRQERSLFGKFLKLSNAPEEENVSGAELSAVSRALSQKGEELRRAEIAFLDWEKQSGLVVNLSEAERVFVDLAMACRDRMMAIPNELAPILRNYLKRETDIGKVRDEIDKAVRHALESLPEKLPGLK